MSIKITGLDEARRKLERLRKNAESISGKNQVPFTELFLDGFMKANTDYATLQEMLDASGIEDNEEIQGEVWNSFVVAHSKFASWDEMFKTASTGWIKRKLTA